MLGSANVHVTIPVRDLEEAKDFYERTLGLEWVDENSGGVYYRSGSTRLFVYPSENAGTNKGTTAFWEVNDPDGVVEALRARGVTFEHYEDMPETTIQGDIHVTGPMRAAWFKDPSGNILCLGNSM